MNEHGSLFPDFPIDSQAPPCQAPPQPADPGPPRLRVPERSERQFRDFALDDWLPADHQARLVWKWVEGLDLSKLHADIKATAHQPGRDATDPRLSAVKN